MHQRRPTRTFLSDAAGAAAAEYLGLLLVVALVIGGLDGALGGPDVGVRPRVRTAICRVGNPADLADCPDTAPSDLGGTPVPATVKGRGEAPALRSGTSFSALKTPAAATAPPTTGTGPHGETVILNRCGPAQKGAAQTEVVYDGATATYIDSVAECVDAAGAARECTTRTFGSPSSDVTFGLSTTTCTAPVTDPVVARAVIDDGADPDTVVTDDCGDQVTGMTPQARAAADQQFGPPPTGPELDTTFDAEMATFGARAKALTGYDVTVHSDREAFESAMRSVNTFVRAHPGQFPVANQVFGETYKANASSNRKLVSGCEIYSMYLILIAGIGAAGTLAYLLVWNKDDPYKNQKAVAGFTAVMAAAIGFAAWDHSRVRRARVAAARAEEALERRIMRQVYDQIENGVRPMIPMQRAQANANRAAAALATAVADDRIATQNDLQGLRAVNQGLLTDQAAQARQLAAFAQRLDSVGYDGQPIARHDL